MNSLFLRTLTSTALLAILASPLIAQKTKVPTKRYLVENGTYEWKSSTSSAGIKIESKETIYFEKWGNTEARFTTTKSSNPFLEGEQVKRQYSLRKDGYITTVDLDKMTGTRMKDPAAMLGNMNAGQQQQFGQGMMAALGAKAKDLDDEVVAGKPCKVTEASTDLAGMKTVAKTWMWKNILMKNMSSGMGTELMEEVLSIKTGIKIPADKLTVPKGAEIREVKGAPFGGMAGLGGFGQKQ